jgi:hypothetical protein
MPAGEAGRLLTAFDRAFASYAFQRTGRRGFRLEIVSTGSGSWWTLLVAVNDFVVLAQEYPDIVALFMSDLGQVISALMEINPEDTPRHLRELARSIARAGKRAGADMIEIANIVQIAIDPVGFEMIARPEPKAPRQKKEIALADWKGLGPQLTEAGALATLGRLSATVHRVGEKWYANAEGMHDVLLPLKLSVLAKLAAVDGGEFTIYGKLEFSPEGHPIAISVESMSPKPPFGQPPTRQLRFR